MGVCQKRRGNSLILKDGDHWEPAEKDVLAWQHAYQEIDVFVEMNAMSCWLQANPAKRKTKRGMNRFVNAWLQRANKQGGSPVGLISGAESTDAVPLRAWSMEDMLTHNFVDCPKLAAKWLDQYGQFVDSKGVRHVREEP